MVKWEYLNKENLRPDALNRLGEDGWELVSVVVTEYSFDYYFKRVREPDRPVFCSCPRCV